MKTSKAVYDKALNFEGDKKERKIPLLTITRITIIISFILVVMGALYLTVICKKPPPVKKMPADW